VGRRERPNRLSAFALFILFVGISSIAVSQKIKPTNLPLPKNPGSRSSQSDYLPDRTLADPPGLAYQGVPAEIPQDEGISGLRLELLRLGTTARLMQVVAHPDDEDGGMLTLEARGHGVSTLLMTLNRGEGGQNKVGSNLSDVLGVLRTEELLASDQYYGAQERFSHVADFGFSKTADETFTKWGGHDIALADMVRVIRTFRPDVLVARFSGTERDGHGHHQASSILAREAFRAAADPNRFPEQIGQGLEPWQVKKFYIGNVCGFGVMTCDDAKWTVKLNTGTKSDALGMSYVQFAMAGLRHQMSQGAANWTVDAGDRFTFYKLAALPLSPSLADRPVSSEHETSFFDGIDTTLPGLVNVAGNESNQLEQLRSTLTEIAKLVATATDVAKSKDGSGAAEALIKIVSGLKLAENEARDSRVSGTAKLNLLTRIVEKEQQAETALNLALGVNLVAEVSSVGDSNGPLPKESDALTAVSPGQQFQINVTLHNGSNLPLEIRAVRLEVRAGWNTIHGKDKPETIAPGKDLHADFRMTVPKDTPYTRPYWHRDNPETESINRIDQEKYATLPFPPPALRARVVYALTEGAAPHVQNGIDAPVVTPFLDDYGKHRSRPLAIVPAFSVELEPGTQVISTHNGSTTTVTVGVTSNVEHPAQGMLRLELPEGWRSEPAELNAKFTKRGEKQDFQFKVIPSQLQEGRATVRAGLESDKETYSEGYTLVTREDLGSFYYYQPARQQEHCRRAGAAQSEGRLHHGRRRRHSDRSEAGRHGRDDDSGGEVGERRSRQIRNHRARHSRLRYAEGSRRQQQKAARFRFYRRNAGRAIQHRSRRFQQRQVHSLSRAAQPRACVGGRSARRNAGARQCNFPLP